MYAQRNEGQWFVIAGQSEGVRVFFTGLYHDGFVPQVSDSPISAAQFATAEAADPYLTRPGYAQGLRIARFDFKLEAHIDPATGRPYTDGKNGLGRPLGTLVMTATEVTP